MLEQLLEVEMPKLRQNASYEQAQKCFELLEKCKDEISYDFYCSLYYEICYKKEQLDWRNNNV